MAIWYDPIVCDPQIDDLDMEREYAYEHEDQEDMDLLDYTSEEVI